MISQNYNALSRDLRDNAVDFDLIPFSFAGAFGSSPMRLKLKHRTTENMLHDFRKVRGIPALLTL